MVRNLWLGFADDDDEEEEEEVRKTSRDKFIQRLSKSFLTRLSYENDLKVEVQQCLPSYITCTMSSAHYRQKVIALYKNLLYLGKEYPKGYDYFRGRLKTAFMKNKDVTEPKELDMLIARGEFVIKEIEALYMLRKYRTLKKRYYEN